MVTSSSRRVALMNEETNGSGQPAPFQFFPLTNSSTHTASWGNAHLASRPFAESSRLRFGMAKLSRPKPKQGRNPHIGSCTGQMFTQADGDDELRPEITY